MPPSLGVVPPGRDVHCMTAFAVVAAAGSLLASAGNFHAAVGKLELVFFFFFFLSHFCFPDTFLTILPSLSVIKVLFYPL